MPASSSSIVDDASSAQPADSSPASSPPNEDSTKSSEEPIVDKRLEAEEENARERNLVAERKRKASLRRKKKAITPAQREAKARELDDLLKQSTAFADILTKKTEVLGRVGVSMDGKALGEHDLQMAEQPKCLVGGTLRDYQLEGITWMYEVCLQGMSGILADEMGLGKTIQMIGIIGLLRDQENYLGPHIIIAPLSTLSNWVNEFRKWAPTIPVVMYHGKPDERRVIRDTKLFPNLDKQGKPTERFPVVCTSYEMVIQDSAHLSRINWEFIIIDEGHRLKNAESRLFQEICKFRSATRFLITGTPLQNNLKELWSLLHFLMPLIFTDWEAFETWFDFTDLEDEDTTAEFINDATKHDLVKKIHAVLQPLLLRRVKSEVAEYLPPKREYVLYAPMTKAQTDLYNVIIDKKIDTRAYLENKVVERLTGATNTPSDSRKARLADKFADDDQSNVSDTLESTEEAERAATLELAKKEISRKKLDNELMQLRLVCNSPHNFYNAFPDAEDIDETIVTSSGKMLLLDRLLPALFERGHKVLIFSQFTTQIDILWDYCAELRGWQTCRISGSVSQKDREEQIEEFNSNSECKLFLLTTRAGGQGINLATADTVILFDSDWNPQQDLQAQDRCHRIGQTRPVIVYRLATKGTVEEELLMSADAKRRLEKLVIKKGGFRTMGQKKNLQEDIDKETLRSLLLKDGEVFKFSGDKAVLSDADLDTLCDRSETAYARAAKGAGNADGYRVVETGANGLTGTTQS
ncbi:hypothetical protein VPNG_01440 [Cytospora leucostoma]|uniref:Uncharacterized protein n=1 Tax=Cytospora leucostoma TaxID=1230097 RepID=A0A423XK00_9PEZI|nr:hypothetical protein VPNG_01440 [Cytospora leucostoma]